MPAPPVTAVAQFLYNEIDPIAYADEQYDWPLLHWCESFGKILSELDYIVHTSNGKVGWSALVDPDQATENTIDYVGQLLGVRFPLGTTFEQKKNKIKDGGNLYRATPRALAGDIQKYLVGDANVYIQERLTSAYTFGVAVFEKDLNGLAADGNFELGVDGWFSPHITDGFDASQVVFGLSNGLNAYTGWNSLQVAQSGVGGAIRKVFFGVFRAGTKFRVRFITRYGTNHILRLTMGKSGMGNVAGQRFQEDIAMLAPNTWHEVIREFTCTEDINNPQVTLNVTSSMPFTYYMDGFSFQADTGQEQGVKDAIQLHKYLGSKFTFTNVVAGEEWTYLTIGATVYKRNLEGFIEKVDSEFTSYDDITRTFARYEFFQDRRYEWLDYNNNFQFGDLTNWFTTGLAATAFATSASWQETPGWAARFIGTTGQYGELTNYTMEVDDRDTYRVKFRKKVTARGGSGKVFVAITWMDDSEVVQDITQIAATVGDSAIGEYAIDTVVQPPAGVTKAAFMFVCDCTIGGSSITAYVDDPSFKYEAEA